MDIPPQVTNEVVYCNHCGAANPRNSVVCCSCGHVHALSFEAPPGKRAAVTIETWVWSAIRVAIGLVLCVARALPNSGATLSAELLGSIFAHIAIPVLMATVIAGNNWPRWSRWFLGMAILWTFWGYAVNVFSRIHLR